MKVIDPFENTINSGLAEKVLFDGEADEYAAIINDYAICHQDCMEILKVVAKMKSIGCSNQKIIDRLIYNPH